MIAFAVYLQQVVARFRVGAICFLAEIKRCIQKVYDLFVCLDGNLKTVFLEYSADFFLDVLSHSGCGISDS